MAIEDTMARVRNVGDKDFVGGWNSVQYRIKPGGEKMVPYAAIINWLGHPLLVNQGPGRMVRQEELNRLRVQYGAYENDLAWEQLKPRLEAFDLESGDRIVTVVDDPLGENVTPAAQSVLENQVLKSQVEQMSAQLNALQSAIAEQSMAAADAASADNSPGVLVDENADVPTDGADKNPAPPVILNPSDTISGASNDKVPGKGAGALSGPTEDNPSKPSVNK